LAEIVITVLSHFITFALQEKVKTSGAEILLQDKLGNQQLWASSRDQ